jgi:hypothetical protein
VCVCVYIYISQRASERLVLALETDLNTYLQAAGP